MRNLAAPSIRAFLAFPSAEKFLRLKKNGTMALSSPLSVSVQYQQLFFSLLPSLVIDVESTSVKPREGESSSERLAPALRWLALTVSRLATALHRAADGSYYSLHSWRRRSEASRGAGR